MVQVLTTGDENRNQVLRVPVPNRASPVEVTPVPASALETREVMRWGASALTAAPASVMQPWVKTTPTAGFSNQWSLVPVTGQVRNLRARVFTPHTQNITFTLFHNLSITPISVTIPAGSFNAVNAIDILDVVAGDILSIDVVAADGLGAATSIEADIQLFGA